ncbi:MAG: hypothetical protein K2I44_10175 [Muribaculaceae bacterium]|nr:hypothetical protein [Muribaculaceae bacterium]
MARMLEVILDIRVKVHSGLTADFPKWRCVYNHFLSWSDRGWFERLKRILVKRTRASMGRTSAP